MSPIQSSTLPTRPRSNIDDWDAPPPPPQQGLALQYLEHADLRAFSRASKFDRSRLEQKLASTTANQLVADIAALGGGAPVVEANMVHLVAKISALDSRVAAPLWKRLETRLIDMADSDLDNCPEAEKGDLLARLAQFSSRTLPEASHSAVLSEMTSLASASFVDPDAACTALASLFEQCKALPRRYQEAPLRNLMLALPFTSSDSVRPQIRVLIDAVQSESRKLLPEQRARIEGDLAQSNATMRDFFATFEVVTELPPQERKEGIGNLVGHMLAIQHNHADALITNTLRFLATEPRMIDADALATLLPMVGMIADPSCRASRLQKVTQLAGLFPPDERVPLLQNAAGLAVTLTEIDRKKMLRTLYRGVPDMTAADQTRTLRAINMLGASLGPMPFAEVLITLPVPLQTTVRETLRAQTQR